MTSNTDEILDKIAKRTFGPGDVAFEERRRHTRFPFPAIQMVAPYRSGEKPSDMAFRPVKCCDLSCGGLSYYLDQPPMGKEIVIALTIRGDLKYLSAKIVRTIATSSEDGLSFLVGCQFIGRLEPV